jgi:nucleoside-diphosphate-sugar epimerase
MVRSGQPIRRLVNPGKGVGHSWAYIPDLAEAFALLLATPNRLRPFERLQFEGTWDPNGDLMAKSLARVIGRSVSERSFPWWMMRLLAPFGGFPAAVRDVEPYWRHPVRLDNARLCAVLGNEPRTPLETALERTLLALGCFGPGASFPVSATA